MASISDLANVVDDAYELAHQITVEWSHAEEDLAEIRKLARKLQLCAETIIDVTDVAVTNLERYPRMIEQIDNNWGGIARGPVNATPAASAA